MNLIKETKNKLSYYNNMKHDLEKFIKNMDKTKLSFEAVSHVNDELDRVNKNIRYFTGVLDILEVE